MKRIYWTAISTAERMKSISEISAVIFNYGTILIFQRYSDLSMGITVEIEECKVNKLYDHLKSIIFLKDFKNEETVSTRDCHVLINVTFTQGSGDLEIEVPALIK
jgi:hypothetical protein